MKRLLILATLAFTIVCAVSAQKKRGASQSEGSGSGNSSQITEITLERTACFGTCPMYTLTLRRDGTATYVGREYVERKGTYKGKIYGFDRLAQLVQSRGYFNLKDEYTVNATDLPSAITSVVRSGRRKTIRNYGESGPVELWGIEVAIDGMIANTKWEKVSDKN